MPRSRGPRATGHGTTARCVLRVDWTGRHWRQRCSLPSREVSRFLLTCSPRRLPLRLPTPLCACPSLPLCACPLRQTVCTYWLRNLCMKGDTCGFLHQFDAARMPVCRNLLKFGTCKEADCPYKHSTEEIKECNMYKLGFCIYGPAVRGVSYPSLLQRK